MTAEQRRKKQVASKDFRRGQAFALEFAITAMAFVMVENMKMEPETVQQTLDELEDFCMDLVKKQINLRDMQEALHDEHGITVRFGKRGVKNDE